MQELTFVIEEAPEGGYIARAIGESIMPEGYDLPDLYHMIRDAITCHFDAGYEPKVVRGILV